MRKYIRFVMGLRKYLNERVDSDAALETARKLLKERISARNENFLNIVDKGVFGYSKSPYLRLLESKKINFYDVKKWVESEGIEATLERLLNEGVYFTVDEFKGKAEVKRNGQRFTCKESMFDNPFLSFVYEEKKWCNP